MLSYNQPDATTLSHPTALMEVDRRRINLLISAPANALKHLPLITKDGFVSKITV